MVTPSMDEIVAEVERLKEATSNIPVKLRSDPNFLQKAWKTLSGDAALRGPKSSFFDPLSLQYALGYKERRYSLTYDTLKSISHKLSVIAAIINTRIAQIASFTMPYRETKSLGYIIRHKDPDHETTASERRFIKQLETFVACCGEPGRENPYTRVKRPKFEQFIKMIVRDTLTFDAVSAEIIPRRNLIPFEFRAVDAATIRIASPNQNASATLTHSYHQRNLIPGSTGPLPYKFSNLYTGQQYGNTAPIYGEDIQYVQVINGQIENVYTDKELLYGVRNPRSDVYSFGYGFSEIEQLITIVTGILHSETFNLKFFTNGSHPKGILNFKGDNWTPEQLEAFKRQWFSQVSGVANTWKTPITQSEGIEWINMQLSNQDMQFNIWVEYLLKLCCGVFLIDPAEINFDLHGGVQQTPLFESSQEWKLKASRDRGLKPLLRFIAGLINEHIIDKIDDHFVFEFAGLDELTEQEKHEMMREQIGSYLTLNEGRRTLDLPDIPGDVGNFPLNPVLIQLMQFLDQKQQKEQEMQQQAQAASQPQQQQPDLEQLKAEQIQQKIDRESQLLPLEVELLRQKVSQVGGKLPEGQTTTEYSDESKRANLGGVATGEGTGQMRSPLPHYTDLVGKALPDFDEWLTAMRRKSDEKL